MLAPGCRLGLGSSECSPGLALLEASLAWWQGFWEISWVADQPLGMLSLCSKEAGL